METIHALSARQTKTAGLKTVHKLLAQTCSLLCLALFTTWNTSYAGGVEEVINPEITGTYYANFRQDRQNISVIEYDGNYDKGNHEARMVVAKEFYKEHPDTYDFLVVFTSFEFETGETLAFHQTLQNQVQGLGKPVYDNSSFYGSQGQLKGFTDMAALSRYRSFDPQDPDFEQVINVLGHETLHQWGSRNTFIDEFGNASEDLVDGAGHWVSNFNLGGSLHHVPEWLDNGDGTYTANPDTNFKRTNIYSPLDLYNMGLYAASEVPDMQLLKLDTPLTQGVQAGATISATPVNISIEQIIAANGARLPAVQDSQKVFHFGFIYLTKAGETVDENVFTQVNAARENFEKRFSILTGGRAIAQVYPEGLSGEVVGRPDEIIGAGERDRPPEIEEGLQWLESVQTQDGSWLDKENTQLRDTSVILELMNQMNQTFDGYSAAVEWLKNAPANTADHLARKIIGLEASGVAVPELRSALIQLQNADGGWGITDDYSSDVLDTALAVRALKARHPEITTPALDYLISVRNSDHAWGYVVDGESNLYATTEVLRAFAAAERTGDIAQATLDWVLAQQNADGGFGDSISTAADTANVILAFIEIDQLDLVQPELASFYLSSQQDNQGSWSGSVYATAMAALAFQNANFPNLVIPDSITSKPVQVYDGDTIKFIWEVTNSSGQFSEATLARAYLGNPLAGGVQIGEDFQLPALGPSSSVTLSTFWDSLEMSGTQSIFFVVDPENTIAEINEGDNTRQFDLVVDEAPAGVELSISDNDIAILPQMPNRLPANLGVLATVRNNGWTDAVDVVVRLVRKTATELEFIEDKVISIPGRSSMAVNFSYKLQVPGESILQIILDPEAQILEENEQNNSASSTVNTQASMDLSVIESDISLSEEPAIINNDVIFTVNLHNYGTIQSPSTTVNYVLSDGVNTETLITNTISIGPGQTIEQQIPWRVDRVGDLTFSVQIDSTNQIAEIDETNNSATRAFNSSTQDGINLGLKFDNFFIDPNPLLEGQSATLRTTVSNSGTLEATNVPVRFYRGDPANGGELLGETIIPSIPSAESREASVVWERVGVTADQLLVAVVDEQNAIPEFSEDDNTAFNVVRVMTLPDLALSNADIQILPSFPVLGDTITVNVSVANLGMQPANADISLYAGSYNDGGTPIATVTQAFVADSTQVMQFTWDYTMVSDALQLSVAVDPNNVVEEGNKFNNTATLYIATQNSDFYVSERFISPDDNGVQDDTIFFFRSPSNELFSQVYVIEAESRELVRTFKLDSSVDFGNVIWDGRDERGRIVSDAEYIITTSSDFTNNVNGASVIVDSNRSPVFDAAGTEFGVYTNYSCDAKTIDAWHITDDEKQVFLGTDYTTDTTYALSGGLYRRDEFSGFTRTIVPTGYFGEGVGYTWRNIFSNDDGSRIIATAAVGSQERIVVVNSDGSNLRDYPDFTRSGAVIGLSRSGDEFYVYDVSLERIVSVSYDDLNITATIVAHENGELNDDLLSVSPNKRYIAFIDTDDSYSFYAGTVKIHDTENKTTATLVDTFEDEVYELNWAPDSSKLVVSYDINYDYDAAVRYAEVYSPEGDALLTLRGEENANRNDTRGLPDADEPTYINWSSTSEELIFVEYGDYSYDICDYYPQETHYVANIQDRKVTPVANYTDRTCEIDERDFAAVFALNAEDYIAYPYSTTPLLLMEPTLFVWAPSERKIVAANTDGYFVDGGTVIDLDKFEKGLKNNSFENVLEDYKQHSALANSRLRDLYGSSPAQKRFLFEGYGNGKQCTTASTYNQLWAFYSLENLTVDLRVLRSSSAGGLLVKGTVADKQLAYYTLEYAYLENPDAWVSIQPSQSEPVIDDLFTSWVPPKADTYLVRLTAFDSAGNENSVIKRVNWSDNPSITDLYRDPTYFSPNGDGVKDETEIHYRVLEPVHLEFEIYNSDGELVDTIGRDHTEIGQEFSFYWDGRNSAGVELADGEYTIRVQGNEFRVYVDRIAPAFDFSLNGPFNSDYKSNEIYGASTKVGPGVAFSTRIVVVQDANDSIAPVFEGQVVGTDNWEQTAATLLVTIPSACDEPINGKYICEYEVSGKLYSAFRIVIEDKAGNVTISSGEQFNQQPVIDGTYLLPEYDIVVADFRQSGKTVPYTHSYMPFDSKNKKLLFTLQENISTEIIAYSVEYSQSGTGDWNEASQTVLLESIYVENGKVNAGPVITEIHDKQLVIGIDRTETYLVSDNKFRVKLIDILGNEYFSNLIGVRSGTLVNILGFYGATRPKDGAVANYSAIDQDEGSSIGFLSLYGSTPPLKEYSKLQFHIQSTEDPAFILERQLVAEVNYPQPNKNFSIDTSQLRPCTKYTGYIVGITTTGEEEKSATTAFTTPCSIIKNSIAYPLGQACNEKPSERPVIYLSPETQRPLDSIEGFKLLELYVLNPGTDEETLLDNIIEPVINETYAFDLQAYPLDFTGDIEFVARLTDVLDEISDQKIIANIPQTPVSINIAAPLNNARICGYQESNFGDINVDIEAEIANAAEGVLYKNYLLDLVSGDVIRSLKDVNIDNLIGDNPESQERFDTDISRCHLDDNVNDVEACGLPTINGIFDIQKAGWPVAEQSQTLTFKGLNKEVSILTEIYNKSGEKVCNQHNFIVDGDVDLTNLTVSSDIFSPDGDGVLDDISFEFLLGEAVNITVEIFKVVDGNVVGILEKVLFTDRQFLTGQQSFTWDGQGENGEVLPDGNYRISFKVVDGCGLKLEKSLTLILDATPPVVLLRNPLANSTLTTLMIPINGIISDNNFSNYIIEYGIGLDPENWVTLQKPSSINTLDGILRNWNTYGLSGIISLRVSAFDHAGHETILNVPVEIGPVDNLIKYIEPVPVLFSPNSDGRRDKLAIRYGLEQDLNVTLTIRSLNSQNIIRTLTANETQLAGDKILNWDGLDDTGSNVSNGTYEILLLAAQPDNEFVNQTEVVQVELDSTSPRVELLGPQSVLNGYINKVSPIIGSITDKNLTDYTVTFSQPSSSYFIELMSGEEPIVSSSLADLADLPDSEYILRIKASDAAENQTELVQKVVIDTLDPELTIVSPVNNQFFGVDDSALTIVASHFDLNINSYSIRYGEGSSPVAWNSIVDTPLDASGDVENILNIENLTEGLYTVEYTLLDKANNSTVIYTTIIIDRTPPTISFNSPENASYINTATQVNVNILESNLLSYELDYAPVGNQIESAYLTMTNGSTLPANTVNYTWSDLPSDGEYIIRATAVDGADNQNDVSITVIVDVTPPDAPQNLVGGYDKTQSGISINWSANQESDLAGYYIYRDGVRISETLITEISYLDLLADDGEYAYTVTALDVVGNESEHSGITTITLDFSAPDVRIFSPLNNSVQAGQIDIIGTATSVDDFKEYRLTAINVNDLTSSVLINKSPVSVIGDVIGQWNTFSLSEGSSYILRLEVEDFTGNTAVDEVTVSIDNTPPAAPTGLILTSIDNDISLAWDPNAETDLQGYIVFRNDQIANASGIVLGDINQFAIEPTAYIDSDLADGEYSYYILAIDQADNVSDPSVIEAGTIDLRVPVALIITPEVGLEFEKPQYVKADSEDLDIANVSFEYAVNSSTPVWTQFALTTSANVYEATFDAGTLGLAYGEYLLRAVATDKTGNVDPAPQNINVIYRDMTKPNLVADLSALVNGGDVNLFWTASDDIDLAGYIVYRSIDQSIFTPLNTTLITETNYLDVGLVDDNYQYLVKSVDTTGNESKNTEYIEVLVYTPELLQSFSPRLDSNVTLTGQSPVVGDISLSITNAGVESTFPIQVTTDTGAFEFPITLATGKSSLDLRIQDPEGNISKPANRLVIIGELPSAPTGLTASLDTNIATLDWNDNSESNIFGYLVYRNDNRLFDAIVTPFDTVSVSQNSGRAHYLIDGDLNGSSYWYPYIYSNNPFDEQEVVVSWNERKLVSSINVNWRYESVRAAKYRVEANYEGSWVTLETVGSITGLQDTIQLQTPYLTDKIRVVIEEVQRLDYFTVQMTEISATTIPMVTDSTYIDSSPELANGVYSYSVSAVNDQGFEGQQGFSAEVSNGDITAPDPVVLTGQAVSSDANLSWTASAATDFQSYQLYRDGELISVVTTVSELAFTDASLKNGDYFYELFVLDVVGNLSEASSTTVSIDISVLTAPENLTATNLGDGQSVQLAWNPPVVGEVSVYQLYRSTQSGGPYTEIYSASNLSYLDEMVDANLTYFYVVTALDANGNESAYSNEANVSPMDVIAPLQPFIYSPTVTGTPISTKVGSTSIYGVTEEGTTVNLYKNNSLYGSVVTKSSITIDEMNIAVDSSSDLENFSPNGNYYLNYNYDTRDYSLFSTENLSEEEHILTPDIINGANSSTFDLVGFNKTSDEYYLYYYNDDTGRRSLASYNLRNRVFTDLLVLPSTLRQRNRDTLTVVSAEQDYFYTVGLYNSQSGLFRYSFATQNWELLYSDSRYDFYNRLTLSNDETKIMVGLYQYGYKLLLIDINNNMTTLIPVYDTDDANYQFSPDSSSILYASYSRLTGTNNVFVYNLSTAQTMQIPIMNTLWNYKFAWLKGGTEVGYISRLGSATFKDIWSYNLKTLTNELLLAEAGYRNFSWTVTGQVIYEKTTSDDYFMLTPAGTFLYPIVDLDVGENIFTAVSTDSHSNVSAISDAISVTYQQVSGNDLSITDSDIQVNPQSLLSGSGTRIAVQIHNNGTETIQAAEYKLVLLQPDNSQLIIENKILQAIPANSSIYEYHDIAVLNDIGVYYLVAEVDGVNVIVETNENNNLGINSFNVLSDLDPITTIDLSRVVINSGQALTGTSVVFNPSGNIEGYLDIRIEDLNAYVVEGLSAGNIDINQNSSHAFNINWDSDSILDGQYVVRSSLYALNAVGAPDFNNLLSEATTEFEILSIVEFNLGIDTALSSYGSFDNVTVNANVEYSIGNAIVSSSLAEIRILDSSGTELFYKDYTVGILVPGENLPMNVNWNTEKYDNGTYTADLTFIQSGGVSESVSTEFSIAESTEQALFSLTGDITLNKTYVKYRTADLSISLENNSNQLISGLDTELRITRFGNTIVSESILLDLDKAEIANLPISFITDDWDLGDYSAELYVLDTNTVLNQKLFSLVDRTKPVVTRVIPTEGDIVNPLQNLVVKATDEDSNIALVEVSFDNGLSWLRMEPYSDSESTYKLPLTGFIDQVYSGLVRATDAQGNLSDTLSISFEIDTLSPVINLSAIQDGAYYNTDVSPLLTVTDKNLNNTVVKLDGVVLDLSAPIVISEEGVHVLYVYANDLAGNSSEVILTITIDKQLPIITVTGVSDGEYYNSGVVASIDISDDNLASSTVLLDGIEVTNFASIMISDEGIHTFVITTSDLAGNTLTQSLEFTLDLSSPAIEVTGISDGAYYNSDVLPVITVTDSNIDTISVLVDGVVIEDYSGFSISEEGSHTLEIMATDLAGNTETVTVVFIIDLTVPVIDISGVVNTGMYSSEVTPIVLVSDANLDAQSIYLNNEVYVSGTPISADGTYVLLVEVTDLAGNTESQTVSFEIDTVAPNVIILSPTDNSEVNSASITINGSTEALTVVTMTYREGVYETTADVVGLFTFENVSLLEGENIFTFSARDKFGNQSDDAILYVKRLITQSINFAYTLSSPKRVLILLPGSKYYDYDDPICQADSKKELSELVGAYTNILDFEGIEYDFVSNKYRFIEKLRSKDYSLLTIFDIENRKRGKYREIGSNDDKRNDDYVALGNKYKTKTYCKYKDIKFDSKTEEELYASVSAGLNVLTIKNRAGNLFHTKNLHGIKEKGKTWSSGVFVEDMQSLFAPGLLELSGQTSVVENISGDVLARFAPKGTPAIIHNSHGAGSAMYFGFNPNEIKNADSVTELLTNSTQYLMPFALDESHLTPNQLVQLNWGVSGLIIGTTYEFSQTLNDELSFTQIDINGTIVGNHYATWKFTATQEEYNFTADIVLPELVGVFDVDASLSSVANNITTEHLFKSISLTVAQSKEELASNLINALNTYRVNSWEKNYTNSIINKIVKAMEKDDEKLKYLDKSIKYLLDAHKRLDKLNGDTDEIHRLLGQLTSVYQRRWYEYYLFETEIKDKFKERFGEVVD